MAKTILNVAGESAARALIRAGHYDMASPWTLSAEDGDAMLGPGGDDWNKYGGWHLGEVPDEPEKTRAHWKYPYGKEGKVFRHALANIRSRATQNGDDAIFEAAGQLMTAMDEEEKKKESRMSLRHMLSSRFGHFAALPATAPITAKAEEGDEEAARAAAKKADDDAAAAKKAEEEEAERRARRAKRRKARKAKGRGASETPEEDDDDEDGDDAADDDDNEGDDDEMKKAAAAGHGFALEAAFRAGARAQRRRCAAILASKAAAGNAVLAMSLAFETSMTASAAIAVLEKSPATTTAGGLHGRMLSAGAAGLRLPPSAPEGPRGMAAIATSWDAATAPYATKA